MSVLGPCIPFDRGRPMTGRGEGGREQLAHARTWPGGPRWDGRVQT